MEVVTTCKRCHRCGITTTGDPCPDCGGLGATWYPVNSASEKRVYAYDTKEQAANMLRICYREALREWKLGDEPTVRIREVVVVPAPGTPGPR
jgi:rRNA maturation protein Nop10